ncbi:MerR family DNA-binding protein [Streptomyces mirabilis]|uniref:MerR family DNA-binding protein n=1 Tax=Streptomyces mirabilis TaxID=68239 RepID=UPI003325B29A
MPEPPRTAGGYRDYPAYAATRLTFIRDAQRAGLTLAEIRGILSLRDSGQAPCSHVSDLVHQHLGDIDRRMAELRKTRTALKDSPSALPQPTRLLAAMPTSAASSASLLEASPDPSPRSKAPSLDSEKAPHLLCRISSRAPALSCTESSVRLAPHLSPQRIRCAPPAG